MILQTVAFDEREHPVVWPDHEYLVIGPHVSQEECSVLSAPGAKLIIKVQPVRWFNPDSTPRMNSPWDRILSHLPYLDTPTLDIPGDGMGGSKIIDFRDPYAQSLATTLVQLATQRNVVNIMFDYGCATIANGLPDGWVAGYNKYRSRVTNAMDLVWNMCNAKQPMGSIGFENIQENGSNDGWPPNFNQIMARSDSNSMFLIQYPSIKLRRAVCGIALARGCLVSYRPNFWVNRWENPIPPELVF